MKHCDLLVVEDDPKIRALILETLAPLKMDVMAESDGHAGEARAREYLPKVIILDLGLPKQSGIEFLRRVQDWFKGSVVVVTAWQDEQYKLEAFELGAEDYVQKPFSPKELLARVKVALRRIAHSGTSVPPGAVFQVGDLSVDRAEHRVIAERGQVLAMTQTEFRFFCILAENEGRLVPQSHLLEQVWGPNHSSDTHYLRILVSRLRKKLVEAQSRVELVTEPGLGYRLLAESGG